MIADDLLQKLESRLLEHHDGVVAAFREHLSAAEASFTAELQHVRQRQADLAHALHRLLTKEADMSALTDSLSSIASDISSVVGDNASKTETLIGYKDENDSALSGAVTSLTSARDALKDTGSKLDAAIAAHNASASTSGTQQPSTGANTSAPVVSTSVGSDSTTAQTADGATTTVQHADGSASTVDASGSTVETNDAAAQAAKDAASAQGVSIPSA